MSSLLLCICLFQWLFVDVVVLALDCDVRTPTPHRTVSLRFQSLRTFPAVVDANATLLDVSDNDVDSVPGGALTGAPSLRVLDARRNRIRMVDRGAFDGLVCLRRVDLSGNQLRHLDPLVFAGNEALRTLDVSGNPLNVDDDSPLLVSASLQVLSAYGTNVRHLSRATLAELPAIQALGLGQVSFVHPGAFQGLENLLVVALTPVCGGCCEAEAFDGLRSLRDSGRLDVNLCEERDGSVKVVVAVSALVLMVLFTVAVAGPCWYLRKCRGPDNHTYTGIDRQNNSKIRRSEKNTYRGNIYGQGNAIDPR